MKEVGSGKRGAAPLVFCSAAAYRWNLCSHSARCPGRGTRIAPQVPSASGVIRGGGGSSQRFIATKENECPRGVTRSAKAPRPPMISLDGGGFGPVKKKDGRSGVTGGPPPSRFSS